MMPMLPAWWDLAVLALSVTAFTCLALTTQRQGAILLGRPATARQKLWLRLAGWSMLVLALLLSIRGWRGNFGPLLWFGWMTMAALAVVLAITYWPWRKQVPARAPRPARETPAVPSGLPPVGLRAWRGVLAVLCIGLPLWLGWALYQTPMHPLLRADAVQGQVGPWTFVLAEEDQDEPPEATASGVFVKHLMLSFCDECDREILAAYVRLRESSSPKSLGLMFRGERWEREGVLIIPPAAASQDQVWLTVVGKDGKVHQTALELARISPAAARFVEEKMP